MEGRLFLVTSKARRERVGLSRGNIKFTVEEVHWQQTGVRQASGILMHHYVVSHHNQIEYVVRLSIWTSDHKWVLAWEPNGG